MIRLEEIVSPLNDYLLSSGFNIKPEKTKINCYTDVQKEYSSLIDGVAMRDLSTSGIIDLKGNDVLDFLNRISTNFVKDLEKQKIAQTVFTTEKGRIIDLCTVLNFDDHQLLVCSSVHQIKVMNWINKYVIADDVQQIDARIKYCILEVSGKHAESFISCLTGDSINQLKENSFKILTVEDMIFFLAKIKDVFGQNKFWFIADVNNSKKIAGYFLENKHLFNFNLVGDDAYNFFRVQNGIPIAPNEINDNFNPLETGLKDVVSFTKGCYIGQEVIARLDSYDKVQKYLCKINFESKVDLNKEYLLFDENDNQVGIVTSVVNFWQSDNSEALGYVKRAFCKSGQELTAASGDNLKVKVRISEL